MDPFIGIPGHIVEPPRVWGEESGLFERGCIHSIPPVGVDGLFGETVIDRAEIIRSGCARAIGVFPFSFRGKAVAGAIVNGELSPLPVLLRYFTGRASVARIASVEGGGCG